MKKIPDKIQNLYVTYLKQHEIPSRDIPFYLKWLRYYLDFCHKYSHTASAPNSLTHFIKKLRQKNQTEQQIAQAKQAISLFYKLIESHKRDSSQSSIEKEHPLEKMENDSTAALEFAWQFFFPAKQLTLVYLPP